MVERVTLPLTISQMGTVKNKQKRDCQRHEVVHVMGGLDDGSTSPKRVAAAKRGRPICSTTLITDPTKSSRGPDHTLESLTVADESSFEIWARHIP
jgi:hypothetical protein